MKKIASILLLLIYLPVFAHKHGENQAKRIYPFIENKGQWHKHVKYRFDQGGMSLFFESNAFHYQFHNIRFNHGELHDSKNKAEDKIHTLKAVFKNANKLVPIYSYNQSKAYYNYYLGNDKNKWKSGVRAYSKLRYQGLYDGIDLEVYWHQGLIKYDYIIAPKADVGQIVVEYKGVNEPTIKNGNLIIKHEFGELMEQIPIAYQLIEGEKVAVDCIFKKGVNNQVSFEFPEGYNPNYPLVIDPQLIFSTYSGSGTGNFGMTATNDSKGNGYMGGTVFNVGYDTTTGVYQPNYAGRTDIAISKFNSADGSQLMYSTYLGGSGNEAVNSMVVDNNDRLVILGVSGSSDFPTDTNAFQLNKSSTVPVDLSIYRQNYNNGNDIVLSKFSEDGTQLLASTYFGGNSSTGLNFDSRFPSRLDSRLVYNYGDHFRGEVVTDSTNNIYVGSSTHSGNLPAVNSATGAQDGIIAKFTPNLDQLIWARYHGGREDDAIYSLKVIDSNKVLVGGGTRSYADFPTTAGSYASTAFSGTSDGFVSIISADGSRVIKSSFVGTSNYDQVYFVEYDRFRNVYAFGQSDGGVFPIKNSSIANPGTGQFIIKMDPNLDSLQLAHTFGDSTGDGTINISPTAFLVDRCLNIYVSGWGGLLFGGEGEKNLRNNMPLKDAFSRNTDNNDFYFYVINRDADSLVYASYFGDPTSDDHVDGGTSRFDKNGVIYQSVCASCDNNQNNFPTTPNAYDTSKNITDTVFFNQCNNALIKYDFEITPVAEFTIDTVEHCLTTGDTIAVYIENRSRRGNNTIWDFYSTQVNSDFQDTTIYFTQAGIYGIRQTVQDTICVLGNFDFQRIIIRPNDINLSLDQPDTTICYTDSVELSVTHGGAAGRFSWSRSPNFNNPLLITSDSIAKLPLDTGENVFYLRADNPGTNACPKFDTTIAFRYYPAIASINLSQDSICENSPIRFSSTQLNVDTFQWFLGNGQSLNDTNFSYTYPAPGSYEVLFIYENFNCPQPDSLTSAVEVVADNLVFSPFSDSLFCGTGDFEVGGSSLGTAKQYLFSSDTSFSDTLNNFPNDTSITIDSTGEYTFYVQLSNGYCFETDSIQSTYITYDVSMDVLSEDSVCTPYNLQLNSTIIGADSFRIDFGNGNFTTTNPDPTINYPNEGTYQIQLTASNARCNIDTTINRQIDVFQNVNLENINDTLICLGDTLQLVGNSFGTAERFIWADNSNFNNPLNAPQDSSIQVFPQAPQNTFYLRGENEICFDEIAVDIAVENLVVESDDVLSICLGDTVEVNADVINSTSQLNFNWQPADSIIQGQGTTTILTAPQGNTWFQLVTRSSSGCEDIDSSLVEVSIPAFTTATIIAETDSAYRGQNIPLRTNRNGPNLVYQWEPAALMDNPNSPSPTITIQNTTVVRLTIIDMNTGCEVIAEKRLKVFEINCDEPDIFIPSAFTPNGDNNNDLFYVRGNVLHSIELSIYNRWGELVFETTDLNKGWDGSYKGRESDPGVFVYHLKAICLDKQEYFTKGNITLIR